MIGAIHCTSAERVWRRMLACKPNLAFRQTISDGSNVSVKVILPNLQKEFE